MKERDSPIIPQDILTYRSVDIPTGQLSCTLENNCMERKEGRGGKGSRPGIQCKKHRIRTIRPLGSHSVTKIIMDLLLHNINEFKKIEGSLVIKKFL